jgi:hypothetical protein
MVWLGPALIVVVRDVDDCIKTASTMVGNVRNRWTFFPKGIVRANGYLLDEPVMKSIEVIEDIPRVDFRLQTESHRQIPITDSSALLARAALSHGFRLELCEQLAVGIVQLETLTEDVPPCGRQTSAIPT